MELAERRLLGLVVIFDALDSLHDLSPSPFAYPAPQKVLQAARIEHHTKGKRSGG
jgi:hypothetical protein